MSAKLIQLCPTLWDPMDCSPPDSSGDSPSKNTGMGCHALLQGIFLGGESVYIYTHTYIHIYIYSHTNAFLQFYCEAKWINVGKPIDRRRQWHPTPVLLLGKSHGQRSLVGCPVKWTSDKQQIIFCNKYVPNTVQPYFIVRDILILKMYSCLPDIRIQLGFLCF